MNFRKWRVQNFVAYATKFCHGEGWLKFANPGASRHAEFLLPMNRSASCPNSQRVGSRTASNNSTGLCKGDALRLGTSRAPVQGFNAQRVSGNSLPAPLLHPMEESFARGAVTRRHDGIELN